MKKIRVFALCLVCCMGLFVVADQPMVAQESSKVELSESEQKFVELLNHAALVGHFSVDGQELNNLKQERYEIEGVSKYKDDLWTFNARIKYGQTDLKIPLVLQVVWAGDTPMITMTDLEIPGLGTFTSRVFFHGDRYAGTWQHGKVGGHMWGKIEKIKPVEAEK